MPSDPEREVGPAPKGILEPSNPLENYYRYKVEHNAVVFYRFALQTQSLHIRDVIAKISSLQRLDLEGLTAVIEHELSAAVPNTTRLDLGEWFDIETLLMLGDLLVNTARDDYDIQNAVLIYDFAYQISGENAFSEQSKLQYVEAVHEVARYEQARHLERVFNINGLAPCQEELLNLQRIRRTSGASYEWLEALNQLYSDLGMASVRFIESDSTSLLDRLAVESANTVDGPKISVIMPTYSPGPGIRTAIRSLLEQSWQNIEIIVVDDASPVRYHTIFKEIKQLDSRIVVVHQNENAGSYAARNTGLSVATGEFITTHDDDDWSHPNKLEMQVNVMLGRPEIVASTSAHIRSNEHLEFRRLNIQARFMQLNYSSLMIRRAVLDEIGPWDTVNRGGDSEFLIRLVEYYGEDKIVNLLSRPLSFSRVWSGSLTSGEMSRGYFSYSRLLYRWAFRQWHWSSSKTGVKAVRKPDDSRPYAVPTTFERGNRNADLGMFDVIYVTDYLRQAKDVNQALQEIETLSDRGMRVGYLHLYSPETNITTGVPPRLFELQMAGKITQVSYDDKAETKLLLVNNPATGMFLDQLRSTVRSHRSVVIHQKTPSLKGSEPRTSTILSVALRNLDNFFNTRFKIVGGTVEDFQHIEAVLPTQRLLPQSLVWNTHVRSEMAELSPPKGSPVVGFHSYGNVYRWPNNPEIFKEIYVSNNYKVRLLGHLSQPIKKFGSKNFAQIELFDPRYTNEEDYLKRIDFWVYFPHYRLKDQIWGPVLSAMRAGKVVILPHRLESIYGDAALYSEPENVSRIVSTFTRDSNAYLAQAELGQRFVAGSFTSDQFFRRVMELTDNII